MGVQGGSTSSPPETRWVHWNEILLFFVFPLFVFVPGSILELSIARGSVSPTRCDQAIVS